MIYDYVIVGAGSAGCLLAARLTEDPTVTVALLESGDDLRAGDEPEEMSSRHPFPLLAAPQFASWRYDEIMARRGLPQPYVPYPRGRGVGGSSIVNGHAAIRGEWPDDYDLWDRAGAEGWGGAEVIEDFIALERDLDFGDAAYHGERGPLPISRPPRCDWSRLDRAFSEAALAAGHPWAEDVNAPGSTGVTPMAHILLDNRRVTASAAFLEPARGRPNLNVCPGVMVDQVLFRGIRAVGVRAGAEDFHGRQVILSAGAIHSPALLMRSGIGPAGHLRELGIDLRRDAPVGDNLLDHAILWLGVRLDEHRDTPATRFANVQVRYSSGLAGAGANDMLMGSMNMPSLPELAPLHGMIGVATWQQFSRGELRLQSADPAAMPVLDMRMLTDERDLVRMRDGARRLWELRRHPALEGLVADVFAMATREPVLELPADPDELDRWMTSICQESAHVSGTCRMGARDDPRSVLDPECRVIGCEGLRVIDASVFPEVPRGNTQLPTLMVAQHMSARMRAAGRGESAERTLPLTS
jgi:5-(hydroxymethyl)furfural/furfural oxidase